MKVRCIEKVSSYDTRDSNKIITFYPKKKYECELLGEDVNANGDVWYLIKNTQGSILATEKQLDMFFEKVKERRRI
jgi:hypothetical protein